MFFTRFRLTLIHLYLWLPSVCCPLDTPSWPLAYQKPWTRNYQKPYRKVTTLARNKISGGFRVYPRKYKFFYDILSPLYVNINLLIIVYFNLTGAKCWKSLTERRKASRIQRLLAVFKRWTVLDYSDWTWRWCETCQILCKYSY